MNGSDWAAVILGYFALQVPAGVLLGRHLRHLRRRGPS